MPKIAKPIADEHNTMQEDEKLVYEEEHNQDKRDIKETVFILTSLKDSIDGLENETEYRDAIDISIHWLQKQENTVRISDVNKEIAIDWKNRKREEKIEKINKRKNKDGI